MADALQVEQKIRASKGRRKRKCNNRNKGADMTDDNKPDLVNHPPHYTQHPSGVECIQITEHLNFCLGNAVKYIWRRGEKDDEIQDLKKAAWYINREIARLEKQREVAT
jgi:hypothetical protein